MYPISENNLSTRTMITNINVEFDNIYIFQNLPINFKLNEYPCKIVAMFGEISEHVLGEKKTNL